VPLSLPGYLLLDYTKDLILADKSVGKGSTSSISKGRLENAAAIKRNAGVTAAAVKVYTETADEFVELFRFEVALLS
jgi:hypothetical protein